MLFSQFCSCTKYSCNCVNYLLLFDEWPQAKVKRTAKCKLRCKPSHIESDESQLGLEREEWFYSGLPLPSQVGWGDSPNRAGWESSVQGWAFPPLGCLFSDEGPHCEQHSVCLSNPSPEQVSILVGQFRRWAAATWTSNGKQMLRGGSQPMEV